MKKALFDDLISSIKEAGKIHRGEVPPARTFVVEPDDIRLNRLASMVRRQPRRDN